MKKLFLFMIAMLFISSCVLKPDTTSTPFPPSETQIIGTLSQISTFAFTQTRDELLIPTETEPPVLTDVPAYTPTSTNSPQSTAAPFRIKIQSGSPAYIKNFGYPEFGCEWLGVAGQIFDANGKPLFNNVVIVSGKIDEKIIEYVGVTGVPEADIYGSGGYEIKLSDKVFNSQNLLFIQIFDLKGNPVSELVSFETFADCDKNLIIINFQYKE